MKAYVLNLLILLGTPYTVMNCYQLIDVAHGTDWRTCTVGSMYGSGCDGKLEQVGFTHHDLAEVKTFEQELKPGDVICFHGGHVAAYLGDGVYIDSTVKRHGVAKFDLLSEQPTDPWYRGPIKVMRWKP